MGDWIRVSLDDVSGLSELFGNAATQFNQVSSDLPHPELNIDDPAVAANNPLTLLDEARKRLDDIETDAGRLAQELKGVEIAGREL